MSKDNNVVNNDLSKVNDQLTKMEQDAGIALRAESANATISTNESQLISEGQVTTNELYSEGTSITTDHEVDINEQYAQSIQSGAESQYESFSDIKDIFEYLDKTRRTQTPSQEFYMLFSDFYENPRLKQPVQVRMLTVAEDKQILSCDDTQERFITAIQLSIVDREGKSFSRKELEELYVLEVEYLYLRYRIHNLSQYHSMSYNCNHCNQYIETKVDLTQLTINRPTSHDDFASKFKLPVSGLVVSTEIPKVKDQVRVRKYIDDLETRYHRTFNPLERVVETNLAEKALGIKMINNQDTSNSLETNKIILDKLPANDLIILNKRYEKYSDLGVVFEVERECPACHRTHRVQIPFSWELFRPSL